MNGLEKVRTFEESGEKRVRRVGRTRYVSLSLALINYHRTCASTCVVLLYYCLPAVEIRERFGSRGYLQESIEHRTSVVGGGVGVGIRTGMA